MSDTLPPRPAPIPPPDRSQIERLNALYDFTAPVTPGGWRSRLTDRVRAWLGRILFRQREFNAALVEHLNRNEAVATAAHHASAQTIRWIEEQIQEQIREPIRSFTEELERQAGEMEGYRDEIERHHQALAAWERRTGSAVASLTTAHEELRTSFGVLQQAVQNLKREIGRLSEGTARPAVAASVSTAAPAIESLDSHKYVGFEDQFRGSSSDIRQRVSEYVPLFQGAQNVLDIGCGRGEFLTLLRDAGIPARGVDINGAMIDVCRQQGMEAEEADAVAYLSRQPDRSVGGLFAAQVVEHLEPHYLNALLEAAYDKLQPGEPIVLETINPACWFAFFESYLRDITHVRALHPDTLKFLLIASGFQGVEIRYRSPYPEHEKLQPLAPHASLGDTVDTLNANVERINRLLFTWLDYAAIGRRP